MSAGHTFRILLKNYVTPKKPSKGKSDASAVDKPTQGIIWIAKTYPLWQSIVLTTMRDMYAVSSNSSCVTQRLTFLFLCINVFTYIAEKRK